MKLTIGSSELGNCFNEALVKLLGPFETGFSIRVWQCFARHFLKTNQVQVRSIREIKFQTEKTLHTSSSTYRFGDFAPNSRSFTLALYEWTHELLCDEEEYAHELWFICALLWLERERENLSRSKEGKAKQFIFGSQKERKKKRKEHRFLANIDLFHLSALCWILSTISLDRQPHHFE